MVKIKRQHQGKYEVFKNDTKIASIRKATDPIEQSPWGDWMLARIGGRMDRFHYFDDCLIEAHKL